MLTLDDFTVEERVAIGYCAPHGIPLSVFLGRVVGMGDPQWLERDAQAAVLWEIEQTSRCSGCGRPRTECMASDDEAPDYEVTVTRCKACETRDAKSREFQEEGASASGLYLSVSPRIDA